MFSSLWAVARVRRATERCRSVGWTSRDGGSLATGLLLSMQDGGRGNWGLPMKANCRSTRVLPQPMSSLRVGQAKPEIGTQHAQYWRRVMCGSNVASPLPASVCRRPQQARWPPGGFDDPLPCRISSAADQYMSRAILASSDMRAGVHGGSQTKLTVTTPTPATRATASATA